MSRAVKQHSVKETEEGETMSAAGLSKISSATSQKKVLQIEGKDLNLVMNATKLPRNQAIELIQKTNGDIKAALELFVNQ